MAASDYRYAADWVNPTDGYRWRLIITPWGRSELSLTAPEFGGSASGDYKMLPKGVFQLGEIKPSAKYDDLPLSLADAPTMKLTADFRPLEGTDLEGFWDVLQDPQFEGDIGGVQYLDTYSGPDPSIQVAAGLVRRCASANYFELFSDLGNPSLDFADFTEVWAGCQYRTDEPVETYNPLNGSNTIAVELVHVFRVIAETIVSEDIYHYVKGAGYTTKTRRYAFDSIYVKDDDSILYLHTIGDTAAAVDYRLLTFYKINDIISGIQDLLGLVFAVILRNSTGSVLIGNPVGSHRIFDWIDLREQNYLANGEASTTQVTEPWIIGTVAFHDDSTNDIDGWLSPTNDQAKAKIGGFKGAYEFLKDLTESFGIKGQTGFNDRATPVLALVGVRMTSPSGLSIGPGTFKGDAVTFKRGKRLSRATCQIVGATSGDVQKVEYIAYQMVNDSPRNVPSVFTNCPLVGERHAVVTPNSSAVAIAFENITGTPTTHWIASLPSVFNRLFYFAQPAFCSDEIAVRCHHYVGVASVADTSGMTTVYDYRYDTLNGIALPQTSSGGPTFNEFWTNLRLALLSIQNKGCIPYAACAFIGTVFSSPTQAVYDTEVSLFRALPDRLGDACGSSFADGSSLTGKSIHAKYAGQPLLISTELDIAASLTKVTLLGIGS